MSRISGLDIEAQEPRPDCKVRLDLSVSPYFENCAKIRGISTRALLIRIVDTILEHQMVLNILDDQEEYKSRRKGEHRYRERV